MRPKILHQLEIGADLIEEDQNKRQKEHLALSMCAPCQITASAHHHVCLITQRVGHSYLGQTGIVLDWDFYMFNL